VIAVDVSQVMLEALRARITQAQLHVIEVLQAGFLTYEHQGTPRTSSAPDTPLHHLPDFWKAIALPRIRQILSPGWRAPSLGRRLQLRPERGRSNAPKLGAPPAAQPPMTVGAGLNSKSTSATSIPMFSWLLEPMIQRIGLVIENAECSDDGSFAKYVLRDPDVPSIPADRASGPHADEVPLSHRWHSRWLA